MKWQKNFYLQMAKDYHILTEKTFICEFVWNFAKGLDHSAPRWGVPCGFPCFLGLILKAIGVLELFLGADTFK